MSLLYSVCRSSQFDEMFYISVNFDFCIMKKLWDLAHEKLVLGTRWASCWDQYSRVSVIPGNCHLCTEISKLYTIYLCTMSDFPWHPKFGHPLWTFPKCNVFVKSPKRIFQITIVLSVGTAGITGTYWMRQTGTSKMQKVRSKGQ